MALRKTQPPSRTYQSISRLTSRSSVPSKFTVTQSQTAGGALASLFFAGFIIVILLYGLTWLPLFTIQEMQFIGFDNVSEEEIQQKIQDTLSASILPVWNSENIFVFNSSNVEKILEEYDPLIQSVSFVRQLPNTLVVVAQERYPVFEVCYEEDCYHLANDGLVLQNTIPGSYVRLQRFKPIQVGEVLYPPRTIQWLENIVALYARSLELGVTSIDVVLEGESGILEVALITPEAYPIRIDFETDIFIQQRVLEAVIKSDALYEQRQNLEYIDLRIPSRVYYRFRGQSEPISPDSASELPIE